MSILATNRYWWGNCYFLFIVVVLGKAKLENLKHVQTQNNYWALIHTPIRAILAQICFIEYIHASQPTTIYMYSYTSLKFTSPPNDSQDNFLLQSITVLVLACIFSLYLTNVKASVVYDQCNNDDKKSDHLLFLRLAICDCSFPSSFYLHVSLGSSITRTVKKG